MSPTNTRSSSRESAAEAQEQAELREYIGNWALTILCDVGWRKSARTIPQRPTRQNRRLTLPPCCTLYSIPNRERLMESISFRIGGAAVIIMLVALFVIATPKAGLTRQWLNCSIQ